MNQVKSGCAVRAAIQEIEAGNIGQATSDAAKAALLAAYPEHLHHRPAIEAQLAMDCTNYRAAVKYLLNWRRKPNFEPPTNEVALVLESVEREIDLGAEHAG